MRWLGPVQNIAVHYGLLSPRLIPSLSGALTVDGWTCEAYCRGTPTPPSKIASSMTALHDATRHVLPRPACSGSKHLMVHNKGCDIDLTAIPRQLVAALRTAWATLPMDQTAIHGDLNPSNILTREDGRIVLIDWDEARKDSPIFD